MLDIRNEGIILEKTTAEYENQAVLNPGCIEVDGIVHMFYRAVRQGNFSTIGYCRLKDNKVIFRLDKPLLDVGSEYEKHGLEDPRVVKHEDGNYYLFYTAYDGKNARAAYAVSKDLVAFEKKGPITSDIKYDDVRDFFREMPLKQKYLLHSLKTERQWGDGVLLWDKDVVMFPKKIRGRYALFHRVLPSIQIIYFDTFEQLASHDFWNEYFKIFKAHTVLDPRPTDEYVGAGCPPIETDKGWLLIYHRVMGKGVQKVYCAGAALLDLNDPTKIISKLKEPLFAPHEPWELHGDVNNVVFPTGAVVHNGLLTVYYGAADSLIAAKSMQLNALLAALVSPDTAHITAL